MQFLGKKSTQSRHATRVPPRDIISHLRHLGQALDHFLMCALRVQAVSPGQILSSQIAFS